MYHIQWRATSKTWLISPRINGHCNRQIWIPLVIIVRSSIKQWVTKICCLKGWKKQIDKRRRNKPVFWVRWDGELTWNYSIHSVYYTILCDFYLHDLHGGFIFIRVEDVIYQVHWIILQTWPYQFSYVSSMQNGIIPTFQYKLAISFNHSH